MPCPVVHLVVGTRPEAIKMAPLANALRRAEVVEPVLVATGQHPTMVAQALSAFDLKPDVVVQLDRRSGEQAELVAQLCPALDRLFDESGSAAVVVQGDTTSVLVGGLAALWRRIPLVHLEAGLRSGDLSAPFPEEAHRRMVGAVADLHLAPTRRAVAALLAEQTPPERILLVGNTVVDAVLEVAARREPLEDSRLVEVGEAVAAGAARLLLVTAHRRESWGEPLDRVLHAVERVIAAHSDVHCVLPAHANPAVRAQVDAALGGHPRAVVTDPLPYPALCRLLAAASLVLTDSGGIQEEAPSFGVPVLVLRDVTERVEAVEAGWAELVGTETDRVVARSGAILSGQHTLPTGGNPFGDGLAAQRCAEAIAWLLGRGRRPAEFAPAPASRQGDGAGCAAVGGSRNTERLTGDYYA